MGLIADHRYRDGVVLTVQVETTGTAERRSTWPGSGRLPSGRTVDHLRWGSIRSPRSRRAEPPREKVSSSAALDPLLATNPERGASR
jgi:hypothetical protein